MVTKTVAPERINMIRRFASLTGLVALTVLGWLLAAGRPAAAQHEGYLVWARTHGSGGDSSWGSAGGWLSRSYFIPRSSTYYYYAPAFTARAPSTCSASYYYAAGEASLVNDRVTLNLSVPADAKICVEGSPMGLGGGQLRFVSPPIQPGYDYTYDIQGSRNQDGREVTHKRHITINAGDPINLTFPVG